MHVYSKTEALYRKSRVMSKVSAKDLYNILSRHRVSYQTHTEKVIVKMPKVSCSVYKCTNNSTKLDKVKKEFCTTHNNLKGKIYCC